MNTYSISPSITTKSAQMDALKRLSEGLLQTMALITALAVTWENKMKINADVSAHINAALVPSVTKVGQSMQENKRFSTNNY